MLTNQRDAFRGQSRSPNSRDVRNRFFNFGSVAVRFLKKNSDSVQNKFGSVCKNSVRFGRSFTTDVG